MSEYKINEWALPKLKQFRTYIDIGAGNGDKTLPYVEKFKRVYAFEPNPKTNQLIFIISLGIMGSFGHLFMSQAAKYADVAVTSPFEYTSFLFVGLMGFLIFAEVPTFSVYLGALIIISSGIFIAYRERKNN